MKKSLAEVDFDRVWEAHHTFPTTSPMTVLGATSRTASTAETGSPAQKYPQPVRSRIRLPRGTRVQLRRYRTLEPAIVEFGSLADVGDVRLVSTGRGGSGPPARAGLCRGGKEHLGRRPPASLVESGPRHLLERRSRRGRRHRSRRRLRPTAVRGDQVGRHPPPGPSGAAVSGSRAVHPIRPWWPPGRHTSSSLTPTRRSAKR
jgi:hypothetical protein